MRIPRSRQFGAGRRYTVLSERSPTTFGVSLRAVWSTEQATGDSRLMGVRQQPGGLIATIG